LFELSAKREGGELRSQKLVIKKKISLSFLHQQTSSILFATVRADIKVKIVVLESADPGS
jgi:hypothetical protein